MNYWRNWKEEKDISLNNITGLMEKRKILRKLERYWVLPGKGLGK